MAKVIIHSDTPSQAIVKAANIVVTVTDSLGRQIGIKKIGAWDRMKMLQVVGSENTKNEVYLGYAALAFSAVKLDDEDLPAISTMAQLEVRVKRLEDEGLEAISNHFQKQADAEETPIKNG